jgi:hypothetical protein
MGPAPAGVYHRWSGAVPLGGARDERDRSDSRLRPEGEALITALENAREELDRALDLTVEIADAARSDDCGGLRRLGFAVAGEAESLGAP